MKNLDSDSEQKVNTYINQTIDEIQKQYTRIDKDWLSLHYRTSIALVLLAFCVECIIGYIYVRADLLSVTVDIYFLKYVLAPTAVNFSCLLLSAFAMRSSLMGYNMKKYIVSLSYVAICFTLYTVHSMFTATIYVFAIGIMMTTLYASYLLTGVTAAMSILLIFISDLFIVWDVEKTGRFTSPLAVGNFAISIIVIITFSYVCMVVIRFEKKKNNASILVEAERKQLRHRLNIDEMTGILNRKAMHQALQEIQDHPEGHSYILAISDIDRFKQVNDSWGHHVGDRCLIEFSRILLDASGYCIPYRYGGDEFCLIFTDVDMDTAVSACKVIQDRLRDLQLEGYPELRLMASFGLAAFSTEMDAARLFTHADHALYVAKKVRNTINVFVPEFDS